MILLRIRIKPEAFGFWFFEDKMLHYRSCEEVLLGAGVTRDDRRNDVEHLRSDGSLSQLPDRRQHQRTS